ncbi:hypothetical protein ABPG73_017121 [Tetrahymena malaccensis]
MEQQNIIYYKLKNFVSSDLSSHKYVHINFMDSKIDSKKDVQSLASALAKCSQALDMIIDLYENKIGQFGGTAIGTALGSCSNLQKIQLILIDCNLVDQGASGSCSGLENCKNLKQLKLSLWQSISSQFYFQACADYQHLFYLSDNKIGPNGASSLGQIFQKCSNLQEIDIDMRQDG